MSTLTSNPSLVISVSNPYTTPVRASQAGVRYQTLLSFVDRVIAAPSEEIFGVTVDLFKMLALNKV
jgi:hypothetical protein